MLGVPYFVWNQSCEKIFYSSASWSVHIYFNCTDVRSVQITKLIQPMPSSFCYSSFFSYFCMYVFDPWLFTQMKQWLLCLNECLVPTFDHISRQMKGSTTLLIRITTLFQLISSIFGCGPTFSWFWRDIFDSWLFTKMKQWLLCLNECLLSVFNHISRQIKWSTILLIRTTKLFQLMSPILGCGPTFS